MTKEEKRREENSKNKCERSTRRENREMSKEMSFFKLDLFSSYFFIFLLFFYLDMYKILEKMFCFFGGSSVCTL